MLRSIFNRSKTRGCARIYNTIIAVHLLARLRLHDNMEHRTERQKRNTVTKFNDTKMNAKRTVIVTALFQDKVLRKNTGFSHVINYYNINIYCFISLVVRIIIV